LTGELDGGYQTWATSGLPAASIELIEPVALGAAAVLDVRQREEFLTGHVPSASNVELGALPTSCDVPSGRLVVMCGHGERAMTGASVLEQAGHSELAVLVGGPDDWAAISGRALATGT